MSDKPPATDKSVPPRWAALFIILGTIVIILSGGGLIFLRFVPIQKPVMITATPWASYSAPPINATETLHPVIERQIVPLPSREFTPTIQPTVTTLLVTPTQLPPTATAMSTTSISTQAPAVVEQQGTPIIWTNEEKNALSWMCYYEVGGMGQIRYDACLSVISTIRARYVYSRGLGTDVLSVLSRPGQFNIPIKTESPHPDFIGTVEQYQIGARGSCSGYFYFDSTPGGPVGCTIYGTSNQFLEFHNGW